MGRLRWYLRDDVLERDNYSCRICQTKKSLEIHHIRHWSKGGDHNPLNLLTLCSPCHNTIHDKLYHKIPSGVNPLDHSDLILSHVAKPTRELVYA
jgi:5-methylcytosine-specific restriction endonuclease McrA